MASPLDSYNISQRFFVHKILDLFYENVLDSYRVRVNNSHTSLIEVYKVLIDWSNNKIKNFDTVESAIKELIKLITKDNSFRFDLISKADFIEKLQAVNKDTKLSAIQNLEYCIHHILSVNNNYVETLFGIIESKLTQADTSLKKCIPNLIELSEYIESLASELINIGYSKIFLYQLISKTFKYNKIRTFDEKWTFFKKVITEKTQKKYLIAFKFNITNEDDYVKFFEKIIPANYLPVATPRTEVVSFLKEDKNTLYKTFEVDALDFYQAIRTSNEQLAPFLDRLHLAYNEVSLSLSFEVLVVDQSDKQKANVQKINYLIDGGYLNNNNFDILNQTINKISDNKFIADDVKDKIKSALRYLRMGNEAVELEQKYISYWIALEHIFSVNIKDVSTFSRMSLHLTNILTIYYLKRNLQYLHNEIKKHYKTATLSKTITDLIDADKIEYFLDERQSDELVTKFLIKYPLLAYKINRVKSTVNQKARLTDYICNHEENVKRHLIRLYRVRNELMHDAAIAQNIENLTANLKYYLRFTLNLLLNHFDSITMNGRLEKEIMLEDFFHKQTLLINNIKKEYNRLEMLKVEFSKNILL
jgi:hypothetical protein